MRMHVKEVTRIIFDELVTEPLAKSQQEFADGKGWQQPDEYVDMPVAVGQTEEGVYVRHGLTVPHNYLSLHSTLRGAVLADTMYDGAFTLVAGRMNSHLWVRGKGFSISESVWMHVSSFQETGVEGLAKFCKLSSAAGRIATRALELVQTDLFDLTTYGSHDLEL